MLQLRDYQKSDAKYIASWCENERVFHMWCANEYSKYPITADDINAYYDSKGESQGCKLTAIDGNEIVGHLTIRTVDYEKNIVRLGFIIINNKLRGQGIGKKIIRLALEYARKTLNAKKVTLGVFENNIGAYMCYKSVGFNEMSPSKAEVYNILGEKWTCRELEYKFDKN